MRSFAEVFDYYQAVVYEREVLADAVANLLLATRSRLVLDCACGTGLPAIDLRARGFRVDCSDANGPMLDQFRRNARACGVEDDALQLRWENLARLGARHDYVMCHGNSLVYAESWEDAAAPAASLATINRHVRGIAAVVAQGGYLHVDIPTTNALAEISYPEALFRGERVSVSERVEVIQSHRRWEQRIFIGTEELSFSGTRATSQATNSQTFCEAMASRASSSSSSPESDLRIRSCSHMVKGSRVAGLDRVAAMLRGTGRTPT